MSDDEQRCTCECGCKKLIDNIRNEIQRYAKWKKFSSSRDTMENLRTNASGTRRVWQCSSCIIGKHIDQETNL